MSLKAVSNSTSTYLHWNDRPLELSKAADRFHESQAEATEPHIMGMTGEEYLGLCNLHEFRILKKMILAAYPAQKTFNTLHIGAIDFRWSRAFVNFIKEQTDLPKDINICIFGIRAEKYLGARTFEVDRCKVFNLGTFKIENLFAKFKEEKFDLENKVDLIVSQWCFRRLADPTGTLEQTFNLLRPRTGILLIDEFFFLRNEETLKNDSNRRMAQLFLDMKVPFLIRYFGLSYSNHHFIVRRPDENPCQIPMSYLGTSDPAGYGGILSGTVTRFKREPQPGDGESPRMQHSLNSDHFVGDKPLFDWLKSDQEMFFSEGDFWRPLLSKDEHLARPALQRAVAESDESRVVELLDRGANINETGHYGYWGNTALHVAILKVGGGHEKWFNIFQLLLKRGANVNLCNGQGYTALHEALYSEDRVFQALIDAGANINFSAWGHPSVIQCAIRAKNQFAIKILMEKGVKLYEDDRQDLEALGLLQPKEELPSQKSRIKNITVDNADSQ